MDRILRLGALLGLMALIAPGAAAHNAPLAPEQYTRFLSDCSDDWGGHSAVRDGHDLVALDLAERWIAHAAEPGLFFLLTAAFGFAETGSQGGPLRVDVEATGSKGSFKVRLATDDNKAFRAEPASGYKVPDVILPPRPSLLPSGQQDGSRILIEFGFRYSSLGLATGDTITSLKAQAYARQDRGDYMPGGYYLLGVSSGGDRECPQSGHQGSGDPGTLYVRRDYTLRGTETPYVEATLNTDALAVSGNQSAFLTLNLNNKLSKQAQTFSVSATLPEPWAVEVQPESAPAPPDGAATFSINLKAEGQAENTSLRLTIESAIGAHAERTIPVYWYPPGVEATIPRTEGPAKSPGLGDSAPILLVVAIALLLRARRA